MSTLFSYCIPFDDGGSPNPFWGICTLNICKPKIRRNARIGDWIVGTGSVRFGYQDKVVYAMEVTDKMTMPDYDEYCKSHYPKKIPNWWHAQNYKERVGDCIYDFDHDPPLLRKSVHNEGNRQTDLGGLFTLLSRNFYYFGDKPQILPTKLLDIVKQGQGHKSKSNDVYVDDFVRWIQQFKHGKNKVLSEPKDRHLFMTTNDQATFCAKRQKEEDELDEQLGEDL